MYTNCPSSLVNLSLQVLLLALQIRSVQFLEGRLCQRLRAAVVYDDRRAAVVVCGEVIFAKLVVDADESGCTDVLCLEIHNNYLLIALRHLRTDLRRVPLALRLLLLLVWHRPALLANLLLLLLEEILLLLLLLNSLLRLFFQ